MKIIIGLLVLILATLILGPIAGAVGVVILCLALIPGVGSFIALILTFGAIVYFLGPLGVVFACVLLLVAHYALPVLEKKKLEKEVDNTQREFSESNETRYVSKFVEVKINDNYLDVGEQFYKLNKCKLTRKDGVTFVHFLDRLVGKAKLTDEEHSQLNDEMSAIQESYRKKFAQHSSLPN